MRWQLFETILGFYMEPFSAANYRSFEEHYVIDPGILNASPKAGALG